MLSNASIDVAFHDTSLILLILYILIIFNKLYQQYWYYLSYLIKGYINKLFTHKYYTNNNNNIYKEYKGIIPYKKYIKLYWIGLLEGDGSIQVNHWKLKSLQYRIVIKLSLIENNYNMLIEIAKILGGTVRILKKDNMVIWVIDDKKSIINLIKIFDKYPLLTSKKICQLNFLINCLNKNSINWYLENRNNKYNNKYHYINNINLNKINKDYLNCWLSGFIEAEGCFSNRKSNYNSFSIGQNDDLYILEYIKTYFNVTNKISLKPSKINNNKFYIIEIYKKDVLNNIINHLNNYPLLGNKLISFNRFKSWFYSTFKF